MVDLCQLRAANMFRRKKKLFSVEVQFRIASEGVYQAESKSSGVKTKKKSISKCIRANPVRNKLV